MGGRGNPWIQISLQTLVLIKMCTPWKTRGILTKDSPGQSGIASLIQKWEGEGGKGVCLQKVLEASGDVWGIHRTRLGFRGIGDIDRVRTGFRGHWDIHRVRAGDEEQVLEKPAVWEWGRAGTISWCTVHPIWGCSIPPLLSELVFHVFFFFNLVLIYYLWYVCDMRAWVLLHACHFTCMRVTSRVEVIGQLCGVGSFHLYMNPRDPPQATRFSGMPLWLSLLAGPGAVSVLPAFCFDGPHFCELSWERRWSPV